jgi:hypothetical protein
MPAYIIRNIDPELWKKAKARAATEGRGLRWVLLTLIAWYVTHGLPQTPESADS